MKRLMTAPFVVICALVLIVSSAVAEPAQSKQSKTECDPGKQGRSYSFKFSGYFKADLIYDRVRVTSGNYAIKEGIHYLTIQGMVETADTTAYAVVAVYEDRLKVLGVGREQDRVLRS